MFKRSNRQSERMIGNPTLIDSNADSRVFENSTSLQATPANLRDGNFSISSRPAFGRRRTGDVLKGLPGLPFQTSEAQTTHESGSSVQYHHHPQPTPPSYQQAPRVKPEQDLPKLDIPQSSSFISEDVSPQEPTRPGHRRQKPSHDSSFEVSPITEYNTTPAEQVGYPPRFSSHIPVAQNSSKPRAASGSIKGLRKKLPSGVSIATKGPLSSTRRFDEFSGNMTDTENGKPAYTSPEAVRLESERRTAAVKPRVLSPTSATSPAPTRMKSPESSQPQSKPWTPEPWKGAGGRYAMVDPMLDQPHPNGQKPSFSAGSHRDSISRSELFDEVVTHDDPQLESQSSELPPLQVGNGSASASDEEISKPLPLFSSPPPRTPEEPSTHFTQLPTPPDQSMTTSKDEVRNFPPTENPSDGEVKAVYPQHSGALTPISSREGKTPDRGQSAQPHTIGPQLSSRFSATTYATTNPESPSINYDSPPATPEMRSDLTPPSSIVHRKRPVPVAGLVKSRKPVPSQSGSISQAEMARRQLKTLPKSPDEAAATTLVASLEAKLDALRRRRQNLKTVLHELTNVVQPSSIAYDMASRAEIKKTVDNINNELATVQKDEHETGLKLHRAWKRQDQESVYEPTHLWVRRVTT